MAVGRDDAHDGVHVLLKAHIEHPISLVEHCVAHLMREPIGPHQRPSVLISVRRPVARLAISGHQWSSVVISAHLCSSAYVVQSRDACLEKVEQSARRGEEHMHLCGEGGRWRRGEHLHARGAGRGAHAHAISGHGRSSEVMGGHPSLSEVISGNHHPFGQPRDLHLPRGPPVHAGGLDAQGLTCGNSTRTQAHSGALSRTGALRGTEAH